MRLLLLSDLHEDVAAARRLAERGKSFDVLVCAGDFGNVRRGVEACVLELAASGRPMVLVPGNNESLEELRAACGGRKDAHVLHGSAVSIGGQTFFGIGGGIPVTPFGSWSWDFSESQADHLLKDCPPGGVLVSHSPPKGIVDRSSSGLSLGSTAVRAAMERCRPRLLVCGHIHASAGESEVVGGTTVVNAGPSGVEWTLR